MTETLATLETRPIESESRAVQLCESAKRAVITTDEHLARSADLAKQINALLMRREEERQSFTKPLKEVARRIELRFKPGDDALKDAKDRITNLQRQYNDERRREIEAEAKRLREEQERKALEEAQALEAEAQRVNALAAEAEAAGNALRAEQLLERAKESEQQAAEVLEEAASAPVLTPPAPPKVARGDVAGVSFRTVWRGRVVNWQDVLNTEMVQANDKVREAVQKVVDSYIKGGVRHFPGVEVYSTEEPITR